MRKTYYFFLLLLLCGCSSEVSIPIDSTPTFAIDLVESQLEPTPNALMYIVGEAKDVAGLKSVRIQIADWQLDKTIELESRNITSYDLNYKFLAPEQIADTDIEMSVTVVSKSDAATRYLFYPTNRGDESAPQLYDDMSIRKPLSTQLSIMAANYLLEFDVIDDNALQSVKVTSEGFEDVDIKMMGNEYSFSKSYPLAAAGEYIFNIVATDMSGNMTSEIVSILYSEVSEPGILYLAANADSDVDLTSDLYGVPMEMNKLADYNYQINYYSMEADTEIRFLTSETTFAGNSIGKNSSGNLVEKSDYAEVTPLELAEANQYYTISVNLTTGEIKATEYTPTATDPNASTKVGLMKGANGWVTPVAWNPEYSHELTKTDGNTFLMYGDLDVLAGATRIDFQLTGVGASQWNPQFRFRSSQEPDIVIAGTAGTAAQYPLNPVLSADTEYRFYFDTHTLRSWAVPTND